jgi:hypothetical protein
MKILIGYSMRSGSTLLQHILNGHSMLRSYSDLSSFWMLVRSLPGLTPASHVCIKPMDLLYLQESIDFYRRFDRFVWLTRDPRDSYLSTIESGYAYLFWLPGQKQHGIDTRLLKRWQLIYRHYFQHPQRWHLVKYENLVTKPDKTISELLNYLNLPFERLYPFKRFDRKHGGDFKIANHTNLTSESALRHQRELNAVQNALVCELLREEMQALGYLYKESNELHQQPLKVANG